MTLRTKCITFALLFASAITQLHADQTNLVQNLTVELIGLKQGRTTTNGNVISVNSDQTRVGTDGIIAALGAATGNSFSRSARLVLITPLDGGDVSIAVRDQGASVDVSQFLSLTQVGSAVQTSTTNKRTGKYAASNYSFLALSLHNSADSNPLSLHFDVNGLAVDNESNVGNNRSELDGSLAGVGDRNDKPMLLQGFLRIRGNSTEVVDDGPAPGN